MTLTRSAATPSQPFDFLGLARDVEAQYRSYLRTTFHFRDPALRRSFEQALAAYQLAKGPFVEAIPLFDKSEPAPALFAQLLGRAIEPGFSAAIGAARPLYAHQSLAIEKIHNARNVVVATGTGSGKTEAFLYPILLHLYQQRLRGVTDAGVRALILYPMNALANDQRERLRALDQALRAAGSDFTFTFGQYTGETPESASSRWGDPQTKLREASPGELVCRDQMRQIPPDILLTNYSMLEYLLTRPDDSPLFDDGRAVHWAFIVLDEAHQYRGANGIEMGMLLRRLRQRLREGGRTDEIRCIATSATLGRGEEDRSEVAAFASDLFGESFEPDDVILPETRIPVFSPRETLNPPAYDELERQMIESPFSAEELGRRLLRDTRAVGLIERVRTAPESLAGLAADLFPSLDPGEASSTTSALIRLLSAATDAMGEPLLQARIHLFLRSLEGAFISFLPTPEILLNRNAHDREGEVFEVALCRECGQLYLAGRLVAGRLVEALRDPGDAEFGVSFFRPLDSASGSDEDIDDEGDDKDVRPLILCLRCGVVAEGAAIIPPDDVCSHRHVLQLERLPAATQKDQAKKCRTCGFRGQDPIGEVIHGTDGPHAVVATTMFREMEPQHRKILAFADGRQQAAFFAWYLQNSYEDLLARNLIFSAARQACAYGGSSTLKELAQGLESGLLRANVLRQSDGATERRRSSWRHLYREFLADQRRISLEGVGLLSWHILWPDGFAPPQVLLDPPWSLSADDALDVVLALFETLRLRRAVSINAERGITLDFRDLDLRATQVSAKIGAPDSRGSIIAWDGPRTHRVDLLRRLFTKRNRGSEPPVELLVDCLRSVWRHIGEFDDEIAADDRLLVATEMGTRRLNPVWWRATIPTGVYRCDVCQRLQGRSLGGVCLRFGCSGTVAPSSPSVTEGNHYRTLAEHELPGRMRVEEHTAQLSSDQAREFQRDFKDSRIDVLSCSTTFELGVDLGDLDAVFLRNVPPESFNYAQRVGRAARRPGRPGFAITYCSRAPHDLFHFGEPLRILRGQTRAPVLRLQNERIAARHVASVALSSFLRANRERFANVRSLLGDMDSPDLLDSFCRHITKNAGRLTRTLRQTLPPQLHDQFGIDGGSARWIAQISGPESRLAIAQSEIAGEYAGITTFQTQAVADRRFQDASWAERRRTTLESTDVLGFLSRKAVIPKYGFPVDVVALDTSLASDESRVELDRDLAIAISEFAPGASLIANKQLWTSYAVKRVPDREWPRGRYAICKDHGVFESWVGNRPPVKKPCCGRLLDGESEYIIPEFGFTTGRMERPKLPTSRPRKEHSTRPYIVSADDAGLQSAVDLPQPLPCVRVHQPTRSEMVVICEGRLGMGFRICPSCGAAVKPPAKGRPAGHKSPFGLNCTGRPTVVSLAHRFRTDVIRLQFLLPLPTGARTPYGFGWSLGYALVEGAATATGSPSNDLSVTVTHDPAHLIPPVILYDAVPGGAGLVASLEDEARLRAAIENAVQRVAGDCGCGEHESCYGCLRNYRNQFMHNNLQRGPVLRYLEAVLEAW